MRVMVFVKATNKSEAGAMPCQDTMTAMQVFNEELVAAGVMKAAEGLHPTSRAVRVNLSPESGPVVEHGPFSPVKDQVSGFWIWEVGSMDEAIGWVKKLHTAVKQMGEENTTLELRPVFGPEDFGADFTPDLQAKEQALRDQIEQATS